MSDGSYGVPEGIISSFPVTSKNGAYKVVQGLEIDEFSRSRIDASVAELLEERDAVRALGSPRASSGQHDREGLRRQLELAAGSPLPAPVASRIHIGSTGIEAGVVREVGHHPDPATVHHDGARLVVDGHLHLVEPRVGQRRPARRSAISSRCSRGASMRLCSGSDQSSGARKVAGLRVGHVGVAPAVLGELAARPSRPLAQLLVVEVGEELPRRARAPLLAHEQHRRERRGEHERRAAGRSRGERSRSRSPVARLPIWSWFCR